MITVIVVKVKRYGFFTARMHPNRSGWNSKQCRPRSDCSMRSSLIWVCTVCSDLSVPILGTFMEVIINHYQFVWKMLHANPKIILACSTNLDQHSQIIQYHSGGREARDLCYFKPILDRTSERTDHYFFNTE